MRFVPVDPESGVERGDFADFLAEGGARFPKGGRNRDLFVAYEQRNDVFLFVPGVRDRALLGVRIGLSTAGSEGPRLPAGRLCLR